MKMRRQLPPPPLCANIPPDIRECARAMNTKDLHSLNLDSLSLEPIEPSSQGGAPVSGRATFNTDTRGRVDRRKGGDRRQALRFEPDRRSGKDRRPLKGWIVGKHD